MAGLITVLVIVAVLVLIGAAMSVKIIKQCEDGVLFRLGRVVGERDPGLCWVSDNVSVDVSAVAYFKVVDAIRSVIAIENVNSAINQIAQTTPRKVVGPWRYERWRIEVPSGRRTIAPREWGAAGQLALIHSGWALKPGVVTTGVRPVPSARTTARSSAGWGLPVTVARKLVTRLRSDTHGTLDSQAPGRDVLGPMAAA